MQRFTRELAQVEAEIRAAKATNAEVEETLRAALHAASNAQETYLSAPPHVRRQINQGFFEKLYIGEDGQVERVDFTEPFRSLLELEGAATAARTGTAAGKGAEMAGAREEPREADGVTSSLDTRDWTRPGAMATWGGNFGGSGGDDGSTPGITDGNRNTPDRRVRTVGGVKDEDLVGATGFEPVTARL